MATASNTFTHTGGYRGPWRPMLASTHLNSLPFNQDTHLRIFGNHSYTSKHKRNNIHSFFAPPSLSTSMPIVLHRTSPLSASHILPGPPSRPSEISGLTPGLGRRPLPTHHIHLLGPRRTKPILAALIQTSSRASHRYSTHRQAASTFITKTEEPSA